jgi:hypothetical protein
VGVLAALGLACTALAQEVPEVQQVWVARENPANGPDEAVEMVYWQNSQTGERAIFTTGYVTDVIPGSNPPQTYTRFATYRYRPDWPEQGTNLLEARAFYPPGPPLAPETHKATGIAVDDDGNVYVTGQSQRPGGNDVDYVTIKYDKFLVPRWSPIERRYNNQIVNGNDIPADIGVDPGGRAVVVTGTSPGPGTNLDIVTIGYDADDGGPPLPAWSRSSVVAYNNFPINGPDRAVELGGIMVAGEGEGQIHTLSVVVLGTSWGGPATLDDYVIICYDGNEAEPGGRQLWAQRYYQGEPRTDIATGLWVQGAYIYATGYAPPAGSAAGAMGAMAAPAPPNYQYTTVSYAYDNDGTFRWEHQWDYAGYDDYPSDITVAPDLSIAVTGRARGPTSFDVGTIVLYDYLTHAHLAFAHGYAPAAGSDDRGAAVAFSPTGDVLVAGMSNALSGTNYDGLALKYLWTRSTPPWVFHWARFYGGFGGHDEARDVAAARFGGPFPLLNVYTTGTSFKSAQGQDFVTIRYRQNSPP